MPRYKITAPDGRQFILIGDKPPSQEAIDDAYANLPPLDTAKEVTQAPQERDYSGETVIGLSIMILFSLFYIYSIVKKKEISGWRRLFLVMVVIPGTVLMFYDGYEWAVFLAVLFCFIYSVVWTIQGFRKK